MHLIYIDDSADEKLAIYSALAIPADQWHAAFDRIRQYRHDLQQIYGIYIYKEFHAWKFVSGRGNISEKVVTKSQRVSIFNDTLDLMTQLQGARLFNVCFPKANQPLAFEWLISRINRSLQNWDSNGILICDQGNEVAITRLMRRMMEFTPIPSNVDAWQETETNRRNNSTDRIVEDPIFKPSQQSYFIQLCDFAAYALLRRENPIPAKMYYKLHESFTRLGPILVREADLGDPEGIIRL